MKSRIIKPSFFKNEDLAQCQPHARLLYQGLWCMADREGRLENRPQRIKVEILPYDDVSVDALLAELERFGFIIRYISGNSSTGISSPFIQISNFKKHQHIHPNEAKSEIPGPSTEDFKRQEMSLHSRSLQEKAPSYTYTSTYTNTSTTSPPKSEPKPEPKTGPKTDPKEDPNGASVKRLQEAFHAGLVGKFGDKVQFSWGVAGKKFKTLLGAFTEDEIKHRIDNWFASTNRFIAQDNGYSVTLFETKFNLLSGGPIADTNGNYAGNVEPGYAAPTHGKYRDITRRE